MPKQNYDFDWMNDETASLWHGLVLGELKTAGLVHDSENNRYGDMSIAALDAFKRVNPSLNEKGDVASLIQPFRDFLKTWEALTGEHEIESLSICIQGSVHTGNGVRQFAIKGRVRPDGNVTAARRYLQGLLDNQLRQMGTPVDGLPVPAPAGASAPVSNGQSTETWDSDLIGINLNNGQKHARIFGGRWMKFGVPVYPEVLATIGIDIATVPAGQYPGKYSVVCAIDANGKPTKAISVTRK